MRTLVFFLLLFLIFSFSSLAQKRIGIDVATKNITNLSFTAHFQKVVKKNYLISYGLFFGNYGKSYSDNDINLIYNNFKIQSPFSTLNEPVTDTSGIYQLLNYNITGKGYGVQFGAGYFHEFNVIHGIRANINMRFGFMGEEIFASYFQVTDSTYKNIRTTRGFLSGAVCPEIYHTIRRTGRITFYYGIKLPYYFTLNRNLFNPQNSNEILFGLEPEFCIGLTRIIGKCD